MKSERKGSAPCGPQATLSPSPLPCPWSAALVRTQPCVPMHGCPQPRSPGFCSRSGSRGDSGGRRGVRGLAPWRPLDPIPCRWRLPSVTCPLPVPWSCHTHLPLPDARAECRSGTDPGVAGRARPELAHPVRSPAPRPPLAPPLLPGWQSSVWKALWRPAVGPRLPHRESVLGCQRAMCRGRGPGLPGWPSSSSVLLRSRTRIPALVRSSSGRDRPLWPVLRVPQD